MLEAPLAPSSNFSNQSYATRPAIGAARRRFAREGCRVFGTKHNSSADSDRAAKSAVLHQLLGDDVDGIAALVEDLG